MMRKNELMAAFLIALFFPVTYSTAIFITQPVEKAGVKAFENPSEPTNVLLLLVILLVVTLMILLIAKYWKKQFIQFFILGAVALTSLYVFYPLLLVFLNTVLAFNLALILAFVLLIFLVRYPEWYVIDLCGFIIAVGATAIFGISLSIPLVIVLLVILAVYDAMAVYRTKHMIDLADSVIDLKLPVLLVIPKRRGYSFLRKKEQLKKKLGEKKERDAFFMGLGDIVMPGILVVSAYRFIPNGLPVAAGITIGILIGFVVLMVFVMKGKPQAGLPFLNSGAILGYIISSFLIFGKLAGIAF